MSAKPLTLKREKFTPRAKSGSSEVDLSLQVEVLVDSGVYHLDQSFSYLAPSHLLPKINVGSFVSVPFQGRKATGLVIEVAAKSKAGLKSVEAVIIPHALNVKQIEFLEKAAQRYVSTRMEFLSSILPMGLISKKTSEQLWQSKLAAPEMTSDPQVSRQFLQISAGANWAESISGLFDRPSLGSTIIAVPTLRDLSELSNILHKRGLDFVEVGAHLTLSQRRQSFNRILTQQKLLVVGTRSTIFSPVSDLRQIIVVDEFSSHHHEQKAPYWNTRDIAFLRAETERASILFVGSSVSSELWRLQELGWIKPRQRENFLFRRSKGRGDEFVSEGANEVSSIRQGLKSGSVLVCVSQKDYAAAIVCRKCRTSIKCNCGARLIAESRYRFKCSLCDFATESWRCRECHEGEILIFKSGAKKVVEELGRNFIGVPILLSNKDKPLEYCPSEASIVVSTYGHEPANSNGYSTVVLRDCIEMLNRPFVRAEEDSWHKILKAVNLKSEKGSCFVSLPAPHPIMQALISGNHSRFYHSLLRDRIDVGLPPEKRVVRISGESRSISGLRSKLNSEFRDALDSLISQSGTVITLKIDHLSAVRVLNALRALQKLRSASGKPLFKIEVDPYQF